MDWKWVVPKIVFLAPVLFVVCWIAWEKILEAVKKERKSFNYSALTFALVAAWLSSEAIEILVNRLDNIDDQRAHGIESKIDQSTNRIIDAVSAEHGEINVKKGADLFESLAQDILSSHETIDIITGINVGRQKYDEHAQKTLDAIVRRASDKNRPIIVRRLFWRHEQLDFLERTRTQYDLLDNVEFAYLSANVSVPITPCVIIDRKIVHFGLAYLGSPGHVDVDITLRDPSTAVTYDEYFDFLWNQSTMLKDKYGPIDSNTLKAVRSSLVKASQH